MPQFGLISIIVPSHNSSQNLDDLLSSLQKSEDQNFELIINDDPRTKDRTASVVDSYQNQGMKIVYLYENKSRAEGRQRGSTYARGEILLHLDTDMIVSPKLLSECREKMESGFEALVIPEVSFGIGFWAQCKVLEKKCYEGEAGIECLRCLKKKLYDEVGGHNPDFIFAEDMDLHLRVAALTSKIGRIESVIRHNEGRMSLWKTMRKKFYYAHTASLFAKAHPAAFRWQANIFSRYWLFLRKWKYFFGHPFVYVGLFVMKSAEFLAAGLGLVFYRRAH